MFAGRSFKLFTVFGFRVGAHWTLPVALALAGFNLGGVAGVLLSLMLFASILAHELGHAVVARRRGVPIAGIDLHMFGGVAKLQAPPRSPDDEVAIALAGPAVSLVLAGLFLGLHQSGWTDAAVVAWLGSANLILGLFNLLPALPLDGGRVLRALLAKRRGLVRGTRSAVTVSRAFAIVLCALGLAVDLWLVALAVLVWMLGTSELRDVERHEVLIRMGAWHPADVPWVRYAAAAEHARHGNAAAVGRLEPLEPDVILPPR